MFNSSPIEAWEGAAAFFSFAGTGGVVFWFWIACILCIYPLYVSLKAENAVEDKLNN